MTEQCHRLQMEVLTHRVEIVDIRCEADVIWSDVLRGFPATALVVVDQPVTVRQAIEIRQEVRVIEVGSAVEDDDGLSVADLACVERRSAYGDATLDCAARTLRLPGSRRR